MEHSITVDNIEKSLQGRDILKGVSFSVRQGEVFGFLGPNGAGKTTTIRILLGLYSPDAGRASIMGADVTTDQARQRVGFVLDDDGLYDGASAKENLAYFARIYQQPVDDERITQVLRLVDLEGRADSKAGTFSRGMRQRLALARALVHDPDVLILDEPTSGIDPSAQIEIRELMVDIAHDRNKAVMLSSHNMDEVQKICARIAVLDRGEVVLSGSLAELRETMGSGMVTVRTSEPIPADLYEEIKSTAEFGLQDSSENLLHFSPSSAGTTPDIVAALARRGARIEEVTRNEASLEEMYTSIVREGQPA
ncbi:ABC transporter ATP-binding protein [Phytoactinopolyspora halophila]|uniref:ABC transporter ATP-binding protein n=1 Tax=Phytoactinopolyspora halophila TaxID=1981511 RepID=UPI0013142D02|nr:ABC transporter ATP-binding protein [Phytoactinopolyspora halophila]